MLHCFVTQEMGFVPSIREHLTQCVRGTFGVPPFGYTNAF